ncbi:MAG: lysophospholipid acyltransferase family protein [Pseudorhodoplanes sp.]
MSALKRLSTAPWFQKTIGVVAAEYLRFVAMTSRIITEPADIYERMEPEIPVILAMWHGQHFMAPFVKQKQHRAKVLISRHRDGEMNAIAAEWLGIETIRGSGANHGDFHRKGGVGAYKAMLEALEEGYNVAMTADIPKVSRVAGLGIIKLARDSGRVIVPVAVATQRRIVLDNWDRTAINLPFGRMSGVAGEPIRVDADATNGALEEARKMLEASLNAATARAYAIADGERGKA